MRLQLTNSSVTQTNTDNGNKILRSDLENRQQWKVLLTTCYSTYMQLTRNHGCIPGNKCEETRPNSQELKSLQPNVSTHDPCVLCNKVYARYHSPTTWDETQWSRLCEYESIPRESNVCKHVLWISEGM